ncbi:T9SS type A sorting domain-containing protein [Chitinophaga sp. Cy-1792]|uniref:T9SS type A sorting domain-containing protein n=1 Tax=Chitinophaga sp. Cy-1792 TaxID=2608339 RepID=UPI001420322F|nr:T9SS type A sorting domain-containing protein [Chitinophaga sp. Cy-1792]NIG55472.1 T9SS type A sorting domain-containing protein [Chitinophaga sp. Cy-1792]
MKRILLIIISVWLFSAPALAAGHCCLQGIDSIRERNRPLKVFPNPVQSHWTVQGLKAIQQMALYSIGGQLLKYWTPNSKQAAMSTPELVNGTYLLRVSFADGTSASQIILKQ